MKITNASDLSSDVLQILEKFRGAIGHEGEGLDPHWLHVNPGFELNLHGKLRQSGVTGTCSGATYHLPRDADFLIDDRMRLAELTSRQVLERTGFIVYLPGSGMGWHTNSNRPGTRFYYTYTAGCGLFRFCQNGTEQVFLEPKGWHLKEFEIPSDSAAWFYHAVEAPDFRISIGFRACS